MATEVVMPQMGESIAEGTITKWLVKVGDTVERDQPLFEISTDKVDAEIPSPAAGTVTEIRHQEGETVPVGQAVAVIGEAGEAAGAAPAKPAEKPAAAEKPAEAKPAEAKPAAQAQANGVDVRSYNVIYEALNDLRAALAGMLAPEIRETVHGRAQVRQIFVISKLGPIAGSYVQEGKVVRSAKVRVRRRE